MNWFYNCKSIELNVDLYGQLNTKYWFTSVHRYRVLLGFVILAIVDSVSKMQANGLNSMLDGICMYDKECSKDVYHEKVEAKLKSFNDFKETAVFWQMLFWNLGSAAYADKKQPPL
jgi:hypothetical protein